MAIKILTNGSFISAKILADAISAKMERRIYPTSNLSKIHPRDKIIRYGSTENILNTAIDLNLNPIEFIGLCIHKEVLADLLINNNIMSVSFYKDTVEKPETYPVLIRTTLNASKGKGINVIYNEEEFNKTWKTNYFWTDFIKTQFELRVHVLGGEIARIFKKVPISDYENENEFPIRNLHNGYHFAIRNEDYYEKVFDLVSKLNEIPKIGKDCFYAMDIGWSKENKNYVVFELNTAPGLNENTAEVYSNFLIDKLDLRNI